jgi:hypothetical protein
MLSVPIKTLIVISVVILSGCVSNKIPPEALRIEKETLETRSIQTRYFETLNEEDLLAASASVLQDLGFLLDESETKLGLLTASKKRDAQETGQIVGAVLMAVIFGAHMETDKDQKIKASLVSRKVEDGKISVRITFQRMIWNGSGVLWKLETLNDKEMYQEFFSKLSKSVFLEEHKV